MPNAHPRTTRPKSGCAWPKLHPHKAQTPLRPQAGRTHKKERAAFRAGKQRDAAPLSITFLVPTTPSPQYKLRLSTSNNLRLKLVPRSLCHEARATERASRSTRHGTCVTKYAPRNVRHEARATERASLSTCHGACVTERAPSLGRRTTLR